MKHNPDKFLQPKGSRQATDGEISILSNHKEDGSVDHLLQELRVYQVELEMQNDELRHVQAALEQSLDRYVSLYEFAPVGYMTLTKDGRINEANLTSVESLGESRESLLKQRFSKFIAVEDKDRWHKHFYQVIKYGKNKSKSCELQICRTDGTRFYAHIDCLLLEQKVLPQSVDLNSDSQPQTNSKTATAGELMMRIAITDVTEIKLAEQELRIAAMVFESQEGMMVTDANNVIMKVNHAFTNITGYTAEDVVGETPHIIQSGRHNREFYAEMWSQIHSTGSWQGEVWNRKKNGQVFPVLLTVTTVKNEEGGVTNYVAAFIDITARKASEDEMQLLAFYDPLTKLPNRRLFLDRLHRAIATSARTRMYCALMFIDLDNFKEINDSLGHDVGDVLLQLVAQRLAICVREGDTVARMGGDEFMVMLEGLSENAQEAVVLAETIGKKILSAINQSFKLGAHEYFGSASIGVTLFTNHRYTSAELQKQADIAMYRAKVEGRNLLRFYNPEMQALQSAKSFKT